MRDCRIWPRSRTWKLSMLIHRKSQERDMRRIGEMKKLRWLCVHGQITDEDVRYFARFLNLEAIEITNSQINGTGFQHLIGLKKLGFLNLGGSRITDEAMRHLAQMPALEQINLESTDVTPAGVEKLAGSSSLRRISLGTALAPDLARLQSLLPGCSVELAQALAIALHPTSDCLITGQCRLSRRSVVACKIWPAIRLRLGARRKPAASDLLAQAWLGESCVACH